MDESAAYVDQHFARLLDGQLREIMSSDRTLIMTSHDAAYLRRYCRTALWLEGGKVRLHGPIEEVLAAYETSPAPVAMAAEAADAPSDAARR